MPQASVIKLFRYQIFAQLVNHGSGSFLAFFGHEVIFLLKQRHLPYVLEEAHIEPQPANILNDLDHLGSESELALPTVARLYQCAFLLLLSER